MPTTPTPSTRILVIDGDPSSTALIRSALAVPDSGSFQIDCVGLLADGLERLAAKNTDAVLLALDLPDSPGIATFEKVFAAVPDVPVLILGRERAEALAKEAVGRGAQDYLLPKAIDSYSLPRVLQCH